MKQALFVVATVALVTVAACELLPAPLMVTGLGFVAWELFSNV